MKKLILLLTLCTTIFSQSIRFDSDTIGYDTSNRLHTKTAVHNMSGESITIDEIILGSITNAKKKTLEGLVDYDGEINVDDLYVELYFEEGYFFKCPEKNEQAFKSASINSFDSEKFTVKKCQNVLNIRSNAYFNKTVYFTLEATVKTSNGDETIININGVWIEGENN